jgi:hypothetical protein
MTLLEQWQKELTRKVMTIYSVPPELLGRSGAHPYFRIAPYGTPMRRPKWDDPIGYQHGMALGDGSVLILDGLYLQSFTSGWDIDPG